MPRSDHYDEDGAEISERCPQCGDVFLADHEDRKHCGACGFTEWK